jgi:hypothetical protein
MHGLDGVKTSQGNLESILSYDNPWMFNGKPFTSEDINKWVGFVYLITNKLTGKKYIGRKYFHSIRKVSKKKKRQRKESDWQTYYGSSDELKVDVDKYGEENFLREILSLHTTRGDCNFEEVKQQFRHNILEDRIGSWYNSNINGKWHRKPLHILEAREYNQELANSCFYMR